MTTQAERRAPKLAPFSLRNNTTGITEADGTANIRTDIWKYQVPRGERLVLVPGSPFFAYLEDASAQIADNAIVEVQVRDASEQDRRTVLGPVIYQRVKEKQDRKLMAKLSIPEPLEIPERGRIVIVVLDDGAIDASDSYFHLQVHRIASAPRR